MPSFPFRRSDNVPYVPLATSPHSDPLKRPFKRIYVFLPLLILIVSLALNVTLIIKSFNGYVNPLDSYQALNNQTLLAEDTPCTLANPSQHAIVTTLYDDSFASAVATLGYSLRKVDSRARLIVLYIPSQVSSHALCIASSTGFKPHPVDRIAPPHDGQGVLYRFVDQYTKLTLWTLDQLGIKSLVYLDADTLVKHNFDEMFTLPWNFAAVPDVFLDHRGFVLGFNAGVLFLHPNTTTFNHMISQLSTASYNPADAEQSFLNQYFGAESVRLPYLYNYNVAIKKRAPLLWNTLWDGAKIVHFTLAKPFLTMPNYIPVAWNDMERHVKEQAKNWNGGFFSEEITWWGEVFSEMKTVYDAELGGCWANYTRFA